MAGCADGRRMMSYPLTTSSSYWQSGLTADNNKYAACKYSNERMRVGSDGSFNIRETNDPIERYDFDTFSFAEMFCRYAKQIEEAAAPRFPISLVGGGMRIGNQPAQSNYECLWAGIRYVPTAADLPNWFVRKMTEVFFGCKWSKKQ